VVSAILEAAEQGVDAIEEGSLRSVFERAGVAPGSFYEYFASREALLGAVVERITERNFETFLAEIDQKTGDEDDFERAIRVGAEVIARHYLRHPKRLAAVIRWAERLGQLPHVSRERDRFADAVAARVERWAPEMSSGERSALLRRVADAVTGVVVVSIHRAPVPPTEEVVTAAGDAAWGIVKVHRERLGLS